MRFSVLKIFFIFIGLVQFVGCASMRPEEYRQAVMVLSDPPGATVSASDGKELGTTPAFIELRRRRAPSLNVQFPDGANYIEKVETNYRWAGSFVNGFLVLTLAPIAWGVDLLTGVAWTSEEKLFLGTAGPLKGSELEEVLVKTEVDVRKIAIAPPQHVHELLSNEVGQKLKEILDENPVPWVKTAQWLEFEKFARIFRAHRFNFESTPPVEYRNSLYQELDVSHVLETTVEEAGGVVRLRIHLRSVFSGRIVHSELREIPSENFKHSGSGVLRRSLSQMLNLFPNLLGIGIGDSISKLEIGNSTYNGRILPSKNFLGGLSKYFNAITLISADGPELQDRWKWRFKLSSQISYVAGRSEYLKLNPLGSGPDLSEVEFERNLFTVGVGPEISLRSKFGSIFLKLVPQWGYRELKWDSPISSGSYSNFGLSMGTEIGFMTFFSRDIALRFVYRAVTISNSWWRQALSKSTGRDIEAGSPSDQFVGLSIGYYFPEVHARLKEWAFRD